MAIDKTLRDRPVPPVPPPGRQWYVNAYEVTREYGGPEEGGWYYDVHRPIGSIPVWYPNFEFEGEGENAVCTNAEAVDAEITRVTEEAKTLLYNALYHGYAGLHGRYSVIGDADLLIVVEEEFATYSPETRPHYE
jgi:hypothetical protein